MEIEPEEDLREKVKNLPGMKKSELKNCVLCGKGMMHSGDIQFYRLSLESFVVDGNAVQETAGLEMMMGGGSFGATMAGVMGPNQDIAKQMFENKNMFLCSPCVLGGACVTSLIEVEDDDD